MKIKPTISLLVLSAVAATPGLFAQGRGGPEWTTTGGDAGRTSSVRTDPRITVPNMSKGAEGFGAFKFLWKLKVDHDPRADGALTQPVLLDRIIGFRGFKSVAFVATSAGTVYAIDTDFGTELWKVHLNYGASLPPITSSTPACPAGQTAAVTRPTALSVPAIGGAGGGGGRGGSSGGGVGEAGRGAPSIYTAGQGRGGRGGAPAAGGPPGLPPTPGTPVPGSAAAAAQAGRAGGGGGGGRGQAPGAPDAAYVIGSDGYVRGLNVQSGWDTMTPLQVLPANTRAAGPIVVNDDTSGFLYVTTTQGCAYTPDAVWAVDLIGQKKEVVSWEAKGATIAGTTGPAFSKDGTVFVATAAGASPLSNAIVALEGKTLKQKAAFTMAKADFASSPIVFQHNDKELIAAASRDGRVFVLDANSLQVPLAVTPAGGEMTGEGLATWQDEKSTRWILAPSSNGVTAYKLVPEGGGVALQRAWATPAITAPLTPLVVNGVVFVASGEARNARSAAGARARSLPSVLYAFDGATGKEVWTSGKSITTTAKSGLSAGAGVVYVPTTDATLYVFGFPIEK